MSAQDFTVLCHCFDVCEVPGGSWSAYAMKPGPSSGNYKKFLDSRPPGCGPFYYADIPGTNRKDNNQQTICIPFRKIYRTIASEVKNSEYIQEALRDGEHDLPNSVMSAPAYRDHPHVLRARDHDEQYPLPLAVYMDGFRYAGQAAGRDTEVEAAI
jgi:hypothetical protein